MIKNPLINQFIKPGIKTIMPGGSNWAKFKDFAHNVKENFPEALQNEATENLLVAGTIGIPLHLITAAAIGPVPSALLVGVSSVLAASVYNAGKPHDEPIYQTIHSQPPSEPTEG
jgi:hypothetical protein